MTFSRIMLKSQGRGNSAYFVVPFMRMNNGVVCRFIFALFRMKEGGRRDSDMILTTRQFKRNYREC